MFYLQNQQLQDLDHPADPACTFSFCVSRLFFLKNFNHSHTTTVAKTLEIRMVHGVNVQSKAMPLSFM